VKITENVFQLEAAKFSHVFLVQADQAFLIDTGMPGLTGKILTELQSLGVSPGDISAILLTHHDVDHIGNAKQLQKATGAELWAPAEDIPNITGAKKRPDVKHLIETIIRPQKPTDVKIYESGWPYGGIRVIHMPGHTPGHTIFQYEDVVFTGDLFKFIGGRFQISSGLMNWDINKEKESLRALKHLKFKWLCPSHGSPVRNGPELSDFLAEY